MKIQTLGRDLIQTRQARGRALQIECQTGEFRYAAIGSKRVQLHMSLDVRDGAAGRVIVGMSLRLAARAAQPLAQIER